MKRSPQRARSARAGQAIVEAGIAMILLCLIVFGGVQVARMFAARDVISYSSSAGARAVAVGFNDFMTYKVTRVAAIPNAGIMTNPNAPSRAPDTVWGGITAGDAIRLGLTAQPGFPPARDLEQTRIPLYLGSTQWGQLPAILDYENWDTVSYPGISDNGLGLVGVSMRQDFPIDMPMHRAFIDADEISIRNSARLANHAELYLE